MSALTWELHPGTQLCPSQTMSAFITMVSHPLDGDGLTQAATDMEHYTSEAGYRLARNCTHVLNVQERTPPPSMRIRGREVSMR